MSGGDWSLLTSSPPFFQWTRITNKETKVSPHCKASGILIEREVQELVFCVGILCIYLHCIAELILTEKKTDGDQPPKVNPNSVAPISIITKL
jgi:hypothetical protein